jgi:hypothetical protein
MRLARTAARLAPILLCLACAVCCGEKEPAAPEPAPNAVEIGRVSWRPVGPMGEQISRTEFGELAGEALAAMPAVAGQPAGRRFDLEGSLDTTAGEGAMVLEARLARSPAGAPISATLVATGKTDTADSTRALVRKGLADLTGALASLLRLADGSRDDWIRALDSAEPDEQRLAAELLGEHKVTRSVPRLSEMLADPREPVAEAAADALAQIGDPSAVPLLIKSIRRGDLRSEVRAIEAMGRIGGPEAEAYLEMTAGGHEVEEVRSLSQRALDGIRSSR